MFKKVMMVSALAMLSASATYAASTKTYTNAPDVNLTQVEPTGLTLTNGRAGQPYVTLSVGAALTKVTHGDKSFPKDIKNNGLVGRIGAGYQINDNFGVETGVISLQNKHKAKQYAADVLVKASLPITDDNANTFYVKVGGVYLQTKLDQKASDALNITKNSYGLEGGVGFAHYFNNIPVGVEYSRIQPFGSRHPGAINIVSLTTGYYFG
jgi:opacity protein-like surface antigen